MLIWVSVVMSVVMLIVVLLIVLLIVMMNPSSGPAAGDDEEATAGSPLGCSGTQSTDAAALADKDGSAARCVRTQKVLHSARIPLPMRENGGFVNRRACGRRS